MARRLFQWWQVAQATAGSLTRPHVDVERADGEVCDILSRSRVFAWTEMAAQIVRRAWAGSRAALVLAPLGQQAACGPLADRIRFCSRCVLIAAGTVLILLAAGTSSGRRFQVIVPLAAAVAAIGADRAAAVLARAWLGRRA